MFFLDEISRTSRLHKIHENKIHENMKNAFIVHEPRYFPSVKSNADGTPRRTLLHGFMARTSRSRVINCIQFILINYLITRGHGSASRNRSWQSLEARLLGFRVAQPLKSVRAGDRLRLTSPCRLFGTRTENRAQFVHRSHRRAFEWLRSTIMVITILTTSSRGTPVVSHTEIARMWDFTI